MSRYYNHSNVFFIKLHNSVLPVAKELSVYIILLADLLCTHTFTHVSIFTAKCYDNVCVGTCLYQFNVTKRPVPRAIVILIIISDWTTFKLYHGNNVMYMWLNALLEGKRLSYILFFKIVVLGYHNLLSTAGDEIF